MNWYDSVIWILAYAIHGEVIKSAMGINHTNEVAENRKGFRLPSSDKWELAACYKGSSASEATADYNNTAATQAAAWYRPNSGG